MVAFNTSLIMSPDERSAYVTWQIHTETHEKSGYISSALEYHKFRIWRQQRIDKANEISQTSQTKQKNRISEESEELYVSTVCGHPLHPVNRNVKEYCPVCLVDICLEFQKAIIEAWIKVLSSIRYHKMKKAWHTARVEFANVLVDLEKQAGSEKEWDDGHPAQVQVVDMAYSAQKAVNLAAAESKYPAIITPNCAEASRVDNTEMDHNTETSPTGLRLLTDSKQKDEKKTVSFAPEIEDVEYRPSHKFHRPNHSYSSGVHACQDEDGWEDMSGSSSNEAALKQFKVYTICEGSVESDYFHSPTCTTIPPEMEHEGIAGSHMLWSEIWDMLEHMEPDRMEQVIQWMDAFIVELDEDGEVVDICFAASEGNENPPRFSVQDENVWTSMKQC